jgi:altronate dehydratase
VLLGTNSRVGGFVRLLERRLKSLAAMVPNLDGIVAVAHTEGAGPDPLNNTELLLRTLAGFIVHPNVGAVLAVDDSGGPVSNDSLRDYLAAQDYPLEQVLHRFWSLSGNLEADLDQGEAWVREWLGPVSALPRRPQPMAGLSVALQCGGSDAFSGISANPLAAAVARRVVANGGRANLAETTELIGAEAYLLANVRDLDTARACLAFIERYKTVMAWHGVTGEGNLSGGNRYRGLYNIALKSIGAATKRDPAVRLDYAVDYAERMLEPGYYFMNTPGNDLESIAGQVAGGSNLIIFTTGNGSITNFPFVPTIKVMTTTTRYKLLQNEMDVNAGAYLDGTPLERLADEMFELTSSIASGTRSKGELAGHSQVSIWRNWRQTGATPVADLMARREPAGRSLRIRGDDVIGAGMELAMLRQGGRLAADRVGLVLPTSLCAGQVARMAAAHLNQLGLGREQGLSRFVALVHTEGCGSAGFSTGQLYSRTLLGYMAHGLVGAGLFLEHGCERTHNDYMRSQLAERGLGPERFGWASVQLDGGIEAVLNKIEDWFRQSLANAKTQPPTLETAGLGALKLGVLSSGALPPALAAALAQITRSVVAAGGTVIVPQSASLLESPSYLQGTLGAAAGAPTLGYGQTANAPGFHIMETPSGHWVETLTGLGATGVEVLLACPGERPAQGHPMIPMLQASAESAPRDGFDWTAQGNPRDWAEQLLGQVAEVASRRYTPRRFAQGDVDFQMTRGLLGLTV